MALANFAVRFVPIAVVSRMKLPEASSDGIHSKYFNVAMHWVPATLIIRARKEGI